MRKEYQDRIKEYCKSNKITVKEFCKRHVLSDCLFTPSNGDKYFSSLIILIIIEPYCRDLDCFKVDIALKMKNLIHDAKYKYLDKDLISKEDYYKIYQILKPYVLRQFELKHKRRGNGD